MNNKSQQKNVANAEQNQKVDQPSLLFNSYEPSEEEIKEDRNIDKQIEEIAILVHSVSVAAGRIPYEQVWEKVNEYLC